MVRLAINGFGRTGRTAARIALKDKRVNLVAINSRANAASHAYLLKYDSIYKEFSLPVKEMGGSLLVNKKKIAVYQKELPEEIPWEKAGVDVVLECTGKFKTEEKTKGHLSHGVKQVIISAPVKDNSIPTVIMGVNNKTIDKQAKIISNASCTTNCLVVVCHILENHLKIKRGFMTTIHSPTDSQNLLDNSNKKTRLRRSTLLSIIPYSTGASIALGRVIPQLAGKFSCQCLRVPPLSASIIDLVVEVEKKTTPEAVNGFFQEASRTYLKGYLQVARDEIVGADIQGNTHSAILDPFLTDVIGGNLVKVFAWYDNEWGYSTRLVDLVAYLAS